jgi:hypothetical protein
MLGGVVLLKFCLLLGCLALLPQSPARAWHAAGHMAVASIAYRDLNATDRRRAVDVLRKHPHYPSWRQTQQSSGVGHDLYLFLRASAWPDDIRGNPRYHRPTWHYVNRPYTPGGTRTIPAGTENVLTALYLNRQRFVDTTLPAADRAVALCWIVHLLGDLHQPFHSVAYLSDEFPEGDRGGNLFLVKTPQGTTNLHSYWDGLFDTASGARAADALGRAIAGARRRDSLIELEARAPATWVEESYFLAIRAGYSHSPDPNRPSLRVPLTPGSSPDTAPTLPDGYDRTARSNAERRIAIAGYRLAGVIEGLFYGQP